MSTFEDPKIEAAYQRGLVYIEKIRSQNKWDKDGVLEAPFVCYGCASRRLDLFMITGDRLPMCVECFEKCTGPLNGFNPNE